MSVQIKIEGADLAAKALMKMEAKHKVAVKRVVKHHGSKLQEGMKRNAVFTGPYSVGETARQVDLAIKDGGFTAEVGTSTLYAPYLEYGTRFMAAQPFVKKSLDQQAPDFMSDLQKILD